MKTAKTFFLVVVFIVAILLVITGVVSIINGSMEMIPTTEQEGKARIFGVTVLVIGSIIGILGILMWLKK